MSSCTVRVEVQLVGDYAALVLRDGPVAYWRLGEVAGPGVNHAIDSSGHALTGTYVTAGVTLSEPTNQPDGNTAALFDGATGYVAVPDAAVLNVPSVVTLEAWVKPNGGGLRVVVAKGAYSVTWAYGLILSAGKVGYRWQTGDYVASSGAVAFHAWTHVVVVADEASGTPVKVYINGSLYAGSFTGTVPTGDFVRLTSEPLSIARANDPSTPTEYFDGAIDEVAIYNYALSASQIQSHYLAGQWTDLSADVHGESGLRWTRGLSSNGPKDRVAQPGLLEFALKNDARNSGATAGWYSPDSASCRTGFAFGIPVRVVANDGTDRPQWRGRLRTIDPDAGQYGPRLTHCTAQDCIGDLVEAEVREVPPQVNKTEVELLTAIVAALSSDVRPSTSFDAALDLYPYAFDDIGGGVKAMDAATRVITSAQGLLFAKGDGTLRYENRHTSALKTSSFSFTDAHLLRDDALGIPTSLNSVFNRVRVTIHPKTVNTGTIVVLYASASPVAVAAGQNVEVWGSYTDPTNRDRVIGGTNFQTIVSGTDFSANTAQDGSGTTVTSSVSVSADCFAADVKFTITNTGTATAYVTHQVRGAAIYDNAPLTRESFAAANYGDRPLDVDLPYQTDANVAQDLADYLRQQYFRLSDQVDHLRFVPQKSTTLMTQALTREIGDVITVAEPQTGVSTMAFVIGIEMTVEKGTWLTATFILGPKATGSVFVFDDAALGVFDASAATLGYA